MLIVEGINVYYDLAHVLKDVSLEVHQGEIVALIGANGAGKTTLLKTISGLLQLTSGRITFLTEAIQQKSVEYIIKAGISLIPEGRRVFPAMTVLENLYLGAFLRNDRVAIRRDVSHVFELFPRLQERSMQLAGTLSGGEQQMLAISRALMSRPRLLLCDEPSMGLAPILVENTFGVIRRLREQGTTILLVEQNARMALSTADRGYVIQNGRITTTGRADQLLDNPDVRKAYLGIASVEPTSADKEGIRGA
ncbi:MAG: ABC transporter ATP-binding protein [Bacillota bacterium]|nr:ABC transporter ATP-binding protein [Bacillota bacterium]